ncbi:hypothetical protein FOZ61_004192 [Perkinsus olseni]|uniref:Uncharacterized protein n=1 Tax=Perkinsus olseni TaxID=32597 RepID=A0A7J6MCY3_PEROL|nr:hypothetical protein FOZ61_004192 [Perkinsus olseni]
MGACELDVSKTPRATSLTVDWDVDIDSIRDDLENGLGRSSRMETPNKEHTLTNLIFRLDTVTVLRHKSSCSTASGGARRSLQRAAVGLGEGEGAASTQLEEFRSERLGGKVNRIVLEVLDVGTESLDASWTDLDGSVGDFGEVEVADERLGDFFGTEVDESKTGRLASLEVERNINKVVETREPSLVQDSRQRFRRASLGHLPQHHSSGLGQGLAVDGWATETPRATGDIIVAVVVTNKMEESIREGGAHKGEDEEKQKPENDSCRKAVGGSLEGLAAAARDSHSAEHASSRGTLKRREVLKTVRHRNRLCEVAGIKKMLHHLSSTAVGPVYGRPNASSSTRSTLHGDASKNGTVYNAFTALRLRDDQTLS